MSVPTQTRHPERQARTFPDTDNLDDLYDDLQPWAAALCEEAYRASLQTGRRRRAARMDFVPGWKEAARQLGRPDAFAAPHGGKPSDHVSRSLTEEDLVPAMRRELEEAFAARARVLTVRADWVDGFLAGLKAMRKRSPFLPGRLEAKP